MAPSLLSVLQSMQEKIEALTASVEELREQNRLLEADNKELCQKIDIANSERDKAILDSEYLSMSHRLAQSPDSIIDTRRHIAGLIRNIDKCINMLKE